MAKEIDLAVEMVREQIEARGIRNPTVLDAMRAVPRHLFVPAPLRMSAYDDRPLGIGDGQTISQPYIVALMTEVLDVGPRDVVLEIGTGSGYQAAVLSRIVKHVYTIEVKERLFRRARRLFFRLGYDNISTRHGDGYWGWSAFAPYDAIIITAAIDHVPTPLYRQLAEEGRIVVPLGRPPVHQKLAIITRSEGRLRATYVTGVMFVPMTGRAQKR